MKKYTVIKEERVVNTEVYVVDVKAAPGAFPGDENNAISLTAHNDPVGFDTQRVVSFKVIPHIL